MLECSDRHAWYAVHVRSRAERKVQAFLAERGIDTYLPTYKRRSKWADRVKVIEEPLFAGYVFSHHLPTSRVSVLTTPGVIDIVGVGRAPVPIEEEEIAAVRALVLSGLPCEPVDQLVVGKRVQVIGGPLAGTTGVITELRKGIRLVVSIGLLQRSVLVEIDKDWVEPAPSLTNARRA